MWIKSVKIENYRAFQKPCVLNINKHITVISGINGIGKSTILAILTNVGELKGHKTLFGKNFRGEFGDVIMYDPQNDTSGKKVEIEFENNDELNIPKTLSFRALIQSKKRYRLLPIKNHDRNTESKINWPSCYLGLSRLIPIGEHDSGKEYKLSKNISDELLKIHSDILSENLNFNSSKSSHFDIGSNQLKSTIITDMYGAPSNSSGQDNTGQIIEYVLSFKKLKKDLGKDYHGGILAIDELDASLHPAAQNKLFDWLLKMSKDLDLQIVFTTHSLTLLEHASKLQLKKPKDVLINYLVSRDFKTGDIKIKENPRKEFYKHNLQDTYNSENREISKIKVFTEDDTARWFIKKIISFAACEPKYKILEEKLQFLDISISWRELLNLYKSDPSRFHYDLFLLDPDCEDSPDLKKYLDKEVFDDFKINMPNSNIFILPSGGNHVSIEKIIRDYLISLEYDNPIFDSDVYENSGITYQKLKEILSNKKNEQDKTFFRTYSEKLTNQTLKQWYKDNKNDIHQKLDLILQSVMKISKSLDN